MLKKNHKKLEGKGLKLYDIVDKIKHQFILKTLNLINLAIRLAEVLF